MISFDDIANYSTCVDENEFFKQYYNEQAHFRYDSNFFQLLYSPSVREFELIEEMQEVDHRQKGLHHLKFYWPENTGFIPELMRYFDKNNYELERLELYRLNPKNFSPTSDHSNVQVKKVTKVDLEEFKQISYIEDLHFGKDFADPKQAFYDWQFAQPSITLFLAHVNQEPAGTLTMITEEQTIEIDDVATVKAYRKQGVATALVQAAVNEALRENKTLILLADGEDTVKEMYKRQGFRYQGYQIGVQKIINTD